MKRNALIIIVQQQQHQNHLLKKLNNKLEALNVTERDRHYAKKYGSQKHIVIQRYNSKLHSLQMVVHTMTLLEEAIIQSTFPCWKRHMTNVKRRYSIHNQ